MMNDVAAIILAAGKGKRMKSDLAKVLHLVAGEPMIRHVVHTTLQIASFVVVVVGHQAEAVKAALADFPNVIFAFQAEQMGTGHAVVTAMPLIGPGVRDIVIVCGDTPLLRVETLRGLIRQHATANACLTLLTISLEDPSGYGRIVFDGCGKVYRIVEQADATDEEKKIRTVNSGAYCVSREFLTRALKTLGRGNAQGEFYLTDVVEQAYRDGCAAYAVVTADSREALGVNTREDLAEADRIAGQRMG